MHRAVLREKEAARERMRSCAWLVRFGCVEGEGDCFGYSWLSGDEEGRMEGGIEDGKESREGRWGFCF